MTLKISQLAAAASVLGTELVEVSKLSLTVIKTATTISALAADNSINDSGAGWVAAGFAVGDQVNIAGFTGNVVNNLFTARITALTTAKMTFGGTDGDVIVDDAAGESVTVTKWESKRTSVSNVSAFGAPPVTIASSATPAIFAAVSETVNMTGTTTVTAFDAAPAGTTRRVIFAGILQLTYNATSMINLSAANITTAAGDVALFQSLGGGNTKMLSYQRADGSALVGGGGSGGTELKNLTFTSDTSSQADSDPGAGKLKWNNATQASATVLYIDDQTADGASLTTFWTGLGSSGYLYIQQGDDATKWQQWKWTAAPVDGTGYRKLTVSLQASAGSIANGKAIYCTFDSSGSGGGSTQGKQSIFVPAGSMQPSIVAGPSRGFVVTASDQPDIYTLDFDQTTTQYAQFGFVMPKKWNLGTLTFVPHWSHTSGGSSFVTLWGLQAVAIRDGDNFALNYGTAQTSSDTGGVNNNFYSGPESAAITVAGTPAAQCLVAFRVYRDTSVGSNLNLKARLTGITVFVTTNADTDA